MRSLEDKSSSNFFSARCGGRNSLSNPLRHHLIVMVKTLPFEGGSQFINSGNCVHERGSVSRPSVGQNYGDDYPGSVSARKMVSETEQETLDWRNTSFL
jgi:hypothetical protein